MALLEVKDVGVAIGALQPLDGISLHVDRGEILGVVGESGSGKSLTALSVLGLLPLIGGCIERGSVRFDDQDLVGLPESSLRKLRGKRIALISQNPMTSLDPIVRIGAQIDQVSVLHLGLSAKAARERSLDMLNQLRIPDAETVHRNYPHQLSGGMKQRIVIAMALAADPDLIVADEPTTALDVTIQAQIIQTLIDLVTERQLALMLITHDMGVVAQACDRVIVMYAGRVAESDTVASIFATPRHPYTRALIACIPTSDQRPGTLKGIAGTVPGVQAYPSGCRYHPRCAAAGPRCAGEVPLLQGAGSAYLACHYPLSPAGGALSDD